MNLEDETFLTAFLDGELDPAQRVRVEASLLSDPRLFEHLRALTTVHEMVAGMARPALDVDVDVASRVVGELDRRRSGGVLGMRRVLGSPGWRVAALASAAAGIVAMTYPGGHGPVEVAGRAPRPPQVATKVTPRPAAPVLASPEAKAEPVLVAKARDLGPGRDEKLKDRELRRFRAMLDSPTLRKVLFVTDVIGQDAGREVGDILEKTPRRNASFGRITVSQGIMLDPEHPGEALVFAVVMDDRELERFQAQLNRQFPEKVHAGEPRPEVVTQLAEVGQVAVFPGTTVADVIVPGERAATALRSDTKDPNPQAAVIVDAMGGFRQTSAPNSTEVTPSQAEGPTLAQERSGPHPSVIGRQEAKEMPPGRRGEASRPGGAVVLVWVSNGGNVRKDTP